VSGLADDRLKNGIYLTKNNALTWDFLRICNPDYFFIKDTTAYYLQSDTLYEASGTMKNWSVANYFVQRIMEIIGKK
jgi:hypothetical protein